MKQSWLQDRFRESDVRLAKIESFAALIEHFKAEGERMSVAELMDEIIDATGYVEELQADSDEEAESRLGKY